MSLAQEPRHAITPFRANNNGPSASFPGRGLWDSVHCWASMRQSAVDDRGGKGGHGCLLSFSTEIDWGGTKSRRTALDMGFPKVRIQNVNFDVKYIYLSVKLSKLGYIPETPRRRLVAPQATAPWIATGFVFALRARVQAPATAYRAKSKLFIWRRINFFCSMLISQLPPTIPESFAEIGPAIWESIGYKVQDLHPPICTSRLHRG